MENKLDAMQDLYKSKGGIIQDEFPVNAIDVQSNQQILISGPQETKIRTKSLVICAGPWTNQLLKPLGVEPPIQ